MAVYKKGKSGLKPIEDEFPWLTPSKMRLLCLDKADWGFTDGEDGIQFNPESLSLKRAMPLDGGDKSTNKSYGGFTMGQTSNDTLSFTLTVDAMELPKVDLAAPSGPLRKFYQLTMPIQAKGPPRHTIVVFQWGKDFNFQGVVVSADFDVSHFDQAGRFKRATVNLSLSGRAFQKVQNDPHKFITSREAPEDLKPKPKVKVFPTFFGIMFPFHF